MPPVIQPDLDMTSINNRFVEFKSSTSRKPYQKQKSALEQQLSNFLAALTPPKVLSSASSEDIIKFLISKDKTGRTVVHKQTCDRKACKCPRRLAAGTVDSLIGKLRAIYNKLGRVNLANPISHSRVKEYLKFTREEQASLTITPKQAVPLFFSKFKSLVVHLRKKIAASASLSLVNKYILVRDTTFFVVDFFTGDRASDLGRLSCNQVFRLKDREGFLIKLSFTKTIRKGAPRAFAMVPFCDPDVCPVFWLDYYVRACRALGVPLSGGYFFRTSDRGRSVGERPFLSSAVNNRLRGYLAEANLNNGETPHSFRVGLSNTLSLLGCSQEEIAQYLGWKSSDMARHYSRESQPASTLNLLESVMSRATGLTTPVSHPGNIQSIV